MIDGINAISLSSAGKLWDFKTRRHQLFPSSVSFCATVVLLSTANVFKSFEKLGKLQLKPVTQCIFQMTFKIKLHFAVITLNYSIIASIY